MNSILRMLIEKCVVTYSRIIFDGIFQIIQIGCVHEIGLDALARCHLREEAISSAVDIVTRYNVIAAAQ